MGAVHSTSVLGRTVTKEVTFEYWSIWSSRENGGVRKDVLSRGRSRSKYLEMWEYVSGSGPASHALQLQCSMALGRSRRWDWEVGQEELCLPSSRFPTPVPICSDTAVAPKDLAAKNSIKTRIFNMRRIQSLPNPATSTKFSVLWWQGDEELCVPNYFIFQLIFITEESSSCMGIKTEPRGTWPWW